MEQRYDAADRPDEQAAADRRTLALPGHRFFGILQSVRFGLLDSSWFTPFQTVRDFSLVAQATRLFSRSAGW
jgi:hypothetical protein